MIYPCEILPYWLLCWLLLTSMLRHLECTDLLGRQMDHIINVWSDCENWVHWIFVVFWCIVCGRLQCYPADGSNGACILCIIWISSYQFLCCIKVQTIQTHFICVVFSLFVCVCCVLIGSIVHRDFVGVSSSGVWCGLPMEKTPISSVLYSM